MTKQEMINQIKRVHNLIYSNLYTSEGALDYNRLTDAFILLASMIQEYDGEDNDQGCSLHLAN